MGTERLARLMYLGNDASSPLSQHLLHPSAGAPKPPLLGVTIGSNSAGIAAVFLTPIPVTHSLLRNLSPRGNRHRGDGIFRTAFDQLVAIGQINEYITPFVQEAHHVQCLEDE